MSTLILTLSDFQAILAFMKTKIIDANVRSYHHGNLSLALIDAAEEELNQNGIEGFSLRGVAKRAGVSHAAPAHHFGDANGLLTILAARGFERFVQRQHDFRHHAKSDPRSQLEASGLGYVIFALENPALFRLMFTSDRPNFDNVDLQLSADLAFDELVDHVRRVTNEHGSPKKDGPMMVNVVAAWSLAHGLADLMVSGRLTTLASLQPITRNRRIATILSRSIPIDLDEGDP